MSNEELPIARRNSGGELSFLKGNHCRTRITNLAIIFILLVFTVAILVIVYKFETDNIPVTEQLKVTQFLPNAEVQTTRKKGTQTTRKIEGLDPLLSGVYRVVKKNQWGGFSPRAVRPLSHPVPYVVISETRHWPCPWTFLCYLTMWYIQIIDIYGYGYSDVGANFYVGGDGTIFVGRGWDAANIHEGFVKDKNIDITFIGAFYFYEPSGAQLKAVSDLLSRGVSQGNLAPDYKLLAHKEIYFPVNRSQGPGFRLISAINAWPHRCLENCFHDK